MNPEVLLFDEPTAALDPRTQAWLIELIVELNRAGKTIVMATHDLDILDDRRGPVPGVLRGAPASSRRDRREEILRDRELLLRVNLIHDHTHIHRLGSGEEAHEHEHDPTHHAAQHA